VLVLGQAPWMDRVAVRVAVETDRLSQRPVAEHESAADRSRADARLAYVRRHEKTPTDFSRVEDLSAAASEQ